MSIHDVTAGRHVPQEFNVIIEIPQASDPIKYEVDKESGALFVDITLKRSLFLPMFHQVAKTAAGLHYVGRQSVHLQISLVANDEPRGLIEQRQTLRHVIDGGIEA